MAPSGRSFWFDVRGEREHLVASGSLRAPTYEGLPLFSAASEEEGSAASRVPVGTKRPRGEARPPPNDAGQVDDAVDEVTQSAMARTRALNAAVRQRPHDTVAWLALAESLDGDAPVVGSGPPQSRLAAAERKTEVLRRAVGANPSSEVLRLALLRACESYMSNEELASEWESAIDSMPASVDLWAALLDRCTSFGSYSASVHRELGIRALHAVARHQELLRARGDDSSRCVACRRRAPLARRRRRAPLVRRRRRAPLARRRRAPLCCRGGRLNRVLRPPI